MKINISQSHVDEFVANFKKFINALKEEGSETKLAFTMIYEHSVQSKKMNEIEKEWVANQLRDVLKTLGLTTIAIMPGGVIIAIIIKALKIQKYVLPSSFEYMNKN